MPEEKGYLMEEFERCLGVWREKRPDDYERLVGKLYEYGSAVGVYRKGTLWSGVLKPQIEYIAGMYGKKPDEVIRSLFYSNDADEFMSKLQL